MGQQQSESHKRIVALLGALTNEWQHRDALLASLEAYYPISEESAGRMLRRDLAALRDLGFEIEREQGAHQPWFRLAGHGRFGQIRGDNDCRSC